MKTDRYNSHTNSYNKAITQCRHVDDAQRPLATCTADISVSTIYMPIS